MQKTSKFILALAEQVLVQPTEKSSRAAVAPLNIPLNTFTGKFEATIRAPPWTRQGRPPRTGHRFFVAPTSTLQDLAAPDPPPSH